MSKMKPISMSQLKLLLGDLSDQIITLRSDIELLRIQWKIKKEELNDVALNSSISKDEKDLLALLAIRVGEQLQRKLRELRHCKAKRFFYIYKTIADLKRGLSYG